MGKDDENNQWVKGHCLHPSCGESVNGSFLLDDLLGELNQDYVQTLDKLDKEMHIDPPSPTDPRFITVTGTMLLPISNQRGPVTLFFRKSDSRMFIQYPGKKPRWSDYTETDFHRHLQLLKDMNGFKSS